MQEIIQIQFWQMAAAYIFVLILMIIVKVKGIPREKEIALSTVRMTLQLILTGFVLVYLFENPHPLLVLLTLAIMQLFAISNIFKRVKTKLSHKLKKIIALAMVTGTLTSLLYFILVVINLSPWYEPRYFIPLAGMLIGNSMTGISLGVTRLVEGMNTQKTWWKQPSCLAQLQKPPPGKSQTMPLMRLSCPLLIPWLGWV